MPEETEINHEWTSEIVCPYCGYKDRDSWEWNDGHEGDGTDECGGCEREYSVSRHVWIKYSTKPLKAG